MEIQLDAKKRLIELYRLGNLTKAKNYQAARIVQHKTAIVKATGESEVAVLEAETLALRRVAAAKGAAEALKQKRRGQKELLKALIEGAGATPEQALRFMWVQAHKQFDNSQTFVDYKKVPMLMESSE